jgi:hypothetical protein
MYTHYNRIMAYIHVIHIYLQYVYIINYYIDGTKSVLFNRLINLTNVCTLE